MARELKGWHVLAITVSAFAVIIAVNLTMAFKAVGTFPGLEVPNSYIASQEFDRNRAAQKNLGWAAKASYQHGQMRVEITDEHGAHPRITSFSATIGRPTHKRADITPVFVQDAGVFHVPLELEPGSWIVHVTATAPDGTKFQQRLDHISRGAAN